jgi:hypothetical protein
MMGNKQRCCRNGKDRPARVAVKVDGRIVRKMLLQRVNDQRSCSARPRWSRDSMRSMRRSFRPRKSWKAVSSSPAALSPEEFIAKDEARNANAQDPTTYVNYKAEEMCKAAKGIDSALGEALLAFHNR